MNVVEKTLEIRTNREAKLTVSPVGITFQDLTANTVEIRVMVCNEGDRRSSPTFVRLESAPFGAFVPGSPLAILPLPSLEPGESRELIVEAARPHPKTLGNFDRVPPKDVLTALSNDPDEPPAQRGAGLVALLKLFRRQSTSRSAGKTKVSQNPFLAADLWELAGREQPHWAGNINVFVGNRAVERHFAKALRIHSGRTNLAMFIVGGPGKPDAYAFDLMGLAADWKAALHDVTGARTLVVESSDKSLQHRQWVKSDAGMMLVVLAVRPPVVCENGSVQVHVSRRSCRRTAIVEFDLDPTAQGPGCYVA